MYVDQAISGSAKQLVDAISLSLTNKSVSANFLSLKVNNINVLTSLPSTANFTMLTISNNAVATQQWVILQACLTSLPSTANFTTLTVANNAVATKYNLIHLSLLQQNNW